MAAEEEVVDLEPCEAEEDSVDEARPMRLWARSLLLVLTAPWIAVFATAIFLINPYREDGEAERAGVHQQLGLPECNFKMITTVPCPSCGMTTSFTLLMHGDVWNSARANFAGTALAAFGVLFIPWALASAFLGRFVFVRALEVLVFRLAIIFLIMLFGRWAFVLIYEWLTR